MPSLADFEIITLKSGIKSLRSLKNHETFHPVTGPRVEANILHVVQQRLVERSLAATDKFVVWDVGLGAGANALAAIEALLGCGSRAEIHSFDKTTAPLEFALRHVADLSYLAGYEKPLNALLADHKVWFSEQLSWQLHLGEFGNQLLENRELPSPHAVLYDPYSPLGNSEMWVLEHFCRLRGRLSDRVPCLLTNYTRSTAVRVTLLLAGFYVGIGTEVGEKAETTIASNHFELLERPLDRRWLERVRISGNSAPLRGLTYTQAEINAEDFERLRSLPQFR